MQRPTPVTTSSITTASGSRRSVHPTLKNPMAVEVASGSCGIQSPRTSSNTRCPAGADTSFANAKRDATSDAVIAVHATTALAVRLNQRTPRRPITAAPAAGSAGISHNGVIALRGLADPAHLPFEDVHIVHV